MTDGAGQATYNVGFDAVFDVEVDTTFFVAATATNLNTGNTSEFSDCTALLISEKVPPEIICPDDIFQESVGPDGNIVEFTVIATDNVDPNPTVVCDPPSGSRFPIRVTTVVCTATDSAGNEGFCSFRITITDGVVSETVEKIRRHIIGTEILQGDDLDEADANGDGQIDVADIIAIIEGNTSAP